MKIERFEDIEGWQMARQLASSVFQFSCREPFSKDFGLRDQINRASGSAMDNIAEGFDGGSRAEFIRFLGYAQRSCTEVMSQLHRACDRDYLNKDEFKMLYELAKSTHAKIGGFMKYLKSAAR